MPKHIPTCPPKPTPSPEPSRSYDIELITPMAGGGAIAGVPDELMPVRAASVRGQLRFWWRIVKGFALGDKMWQREEEIFGSTSFPSPLLVRIQSSSVTNWVAPEQIGDLSLKYILFPMIENSQRLIQEGITFRLDTRWETEGRLIKRRKEQNESRAKSKKAALPGVIDPLDEDLDLAVKAWITFGGIGARTRRGCGALFVANSSPALPTDNVEEWMRPFFQHGSQIEKILCYREVMSPVDAWRCVSETWKKFRQPGPARRGEVRRRFPDAESIRRIVGRRSRRGRVIPESELPSGFPRAELGLPILYQFKDPTDPGVTTVNRSGLNADGRPFQRMASPFILKPFAVGKSRAVPMIVLLKTPRVTSVQLTPVPHGTREYSVLGSPLVGSPAGSAIESFLAFADANGFKEVSR